MLRLACLPRARNLVVRGDVRAVARLLVRAIVASRVEEDANGSGGNKLFVALVAAV
jgi:hypothetical protein